MGRRRRGQLTLTRVSRVSRRLSAVAQEVLFRRPYVGAQVFFFRLIRTLLRNSNFCSKVRSLEIYLPDLRPYGSLHKNLMAEARAQLARYPQDTSAWEKTLVDRRTRAWVGLLVSLVPGLTSFHFEGVEVSTATTTIQVSVSTLIIPRRSLNLPRSSSLVC
jgi:hypothetical protein